MTPEEKSVRALRRIMNSTIVPIVYGQAELGRFRAYWPRPAGMDDAACDILATMLRARLPTVVVSVTRKYEVQCGPRDLCTQTCCCYYLWCCCIWNCGMPPILGIEFAWQMPPAKPMTTRPVATVSTRPVATESTPLLTADAVAKTAPPVATGPSAPPCPTAPDAA
jgi:hypothetical protein